MAFGKNAEDLNKVRGFGASSARDIQRRTHEYNQAREDQRAPRGGGNRFSNIFRPSLEEYTLVRLVPGMFEVPIGYKDGTISPMTLEYFPFIEHYHATLKKSSVCSGGPLHFTRTKREPCVGCDKYWGERPTEVDPGTGKKKKGPMSKRDMVVFTVVHLTPHHKTASVDREGKVRMNEETNEPYYDWVECAGRVCPMCKEGLEKKPAMRKHWPMGTSHFSLLMGEFADQIAGSCGGCGGRDTIATNAWICNKCGEAIVDMSETSLPDEEIKKISSEKIRCGHCGNTDYLEEVISCTDCSDAHRATIYDADISVKRASTGTGDQTVLMMNKFFVRPLEEMYKEYAQPFDLPKIYVPTPLETQVQIYEGKPVTRPGATKYSQSR